MVIVVITVTNVANFWMKPLVGIPSAQGLRQWISVLPGLTLAGKQNAPEIMSVGVELGAVEEVAIHDATGFFEIRYSDDCTAGGGSA